MTARDYDRIAFLNAPDATLLLADRVILRASLRAEDVFGWPRSGLEGQSIRMLYPGQADFRIMGERARAAMRPGEVYRDERFMRHRDGRLLWVEGRGTALDSEDPQKLALWTYRPLEPHGAAPKALTPAEKRVAGYLVNGFTSKEIAAALGCSPRTVDVHRAAMIRKLGVRNTPEMIRALLAAG